VRLGDYFLRNEFFSSYWKTFRQALCTDAAFAS
jgi:hypothetical protein